MTPIPMPIRPQLATSTDGPIQITFAMIKSHVVDDPVVIGNVFDDILDQGWIVVAMRRELLTQHEIETLYEQHVGKPYWPDLADSVSQGVILMALCGADVIAGWRRLLGATNSMLADPETLRAMYGSRKRVADNVAHGSDSPKAAARELGIFFPASISLQGGNPLPYMPPTTSIIRPAPRPTFVPAHANVDLIGGPDDAA